MQSKDNQFLNLLSGFRRATRGSIHIGNQDVTNMKPYERAQVGLARTFQTSSVFANLTCLENVRIAAQAANGKSMNLTKNAYKFSDVVAIAQDCLAKVGASCAPLEALAKAPIVWPICVANMLPINPRKICAIGPSCAAIAACCGSKPSRPSI